MTCPSAGLRPFIDDFERVPGFFGARYFPSSCTLWNLSSSDLFVQFCMARASVAVVALLSVASFAAAQSAGSNARPRVSDLGLKIGILPAGHFNAITDVPRG